MSDVFDCNFFARNNLNSESSIASWPRQVTARDAVPEQSWLLCYRSFNELLGLEIVTRMANGRCRTGTVPDSGLYCQCVDFSLWPVHDSESDSDPDGPASGNCGHRYIGKVCCLLLVRARLGGIAQAVTDSGSKADASEPGSKISHVVASLSRSNLTRYAVSSSVSS